MGTRNINKSKTKHLFEDSSSDEGENIEPFKVNKDFVDKYDKWKSREEYQKLKEKFGDDELNSDTGSSTDDELAGAEDPEFDMDFFRVVAVLSTKNKEVLNKDKTFFKDSYNLKAVKLNKEKPVTAKNIHNQFILQDDDTRNANFDDNELSPSQDSIGPSRKLPSDFVTFADDVSDKDEGNIDFMEKHEIIKKNNSSKPTNDAVDFLTGKSNSLNDETDEKLFKELKNKWENDMSKEDKFLMDYFINKRYLDDEDPTIERDEHHHAIDVESISEDEQTFDRMQEYESKYRFRFEEPDQEYIRKYPRVTQGTLKKQDTRNRDERERKKQREMEEKEKTEQQMKRFKALKRKEIQERIETLKNVAGISDYKDMNFEGLDLEGDFDPEAHDRAMTEMFDDDYYDDAKQENDQPKVDEEIQRQLDVEYEKLEQVEFIDKSDFKYMNVAPNTFGLTTEEILMAKDTELNKWFSLKKTMSLNRNQDMESSLKKSYELRAANEDVKKRILPSLYCESIEESWEQEEERKKKKNFKKKQSRLRKLEAEKIIEQEKLESAPVTKTEKKKIKKREKALKLEQEQKIILQKEAEERLKQNESAKETEEVQNRSRSDESSEKEESSLETDKSLSRRQKRNKKRKREAMESLEETNEGLSEDLNEPIIIQSPKEEPSEKKTRYFNPVFEPIRGISDERMEAYGNNPKKLKKKLIAMSSKVKK